MPISIGILAMSYYVPQRRKTVRDVFDDEDVPFGTLAKNIDFARDTGIDEVRITEEMPSEMALRASRQTLRESGLDPSEIDVIVDFSSIPGDFPGPMWSVAGMVQDDLGCDRAFTTAVNCGGCASYHVALKLACALLATDNRLQTALLVAGDRTPAYNKTYYPITVASDGGSCLILKKGHHRRIVLGCEIHTVGRLHDVWYVAGFPHERPVEPPTEELLHMRCDLKKFNEEVIPANFIVFRNVMNDLLRRQAKTLDDVDYFIYPSFSAWDQGSFMRAFDIPPEKIYLDNLKLFGHVQENDMVINYVDAVRDNRIGEGATVMVVSNGAGFLWGAALVRE